MSETRTVEPNVTARALAWVGGRHVGMSSKCIWRVMMGVDESDVDAFDRGAYPLDPDDFSRCRRLLKLIPEWRARLPEMATQNAAWAALVERWDEIEASFVAEVGDEPTWGDMAPKTYELMRSIIYPNERHHSRARTTEPKP